MTAKSLKSLAIMNTMPFAAKLAKSNYKSLVFSIRGVDGNVFVNVNNYRQIEDAVLDVWVEYLKVLDHKKTAFVEKQKKRKMDGVE